MHAAWLVSFKILQNIFLLYKNHSSPDINYDNVFLFIVKPIIFYLIRTYNSFNLWSNRYVISKA